MNEVCCNPFFHKSISLTPTPADTPTSLNMTITNSGNISNLENIELVMCQNPDSLITGAPVPMTITINGTAVPLRNKYSLPIQSNRLTTRKRYFGAYVNDGQNAYVILWNTPNCPAYAQ